MPLQSFLRLHNWKTRWFLQKNCFCWCQQSLLGNYDGEIPRVISGSCSCCFLPIIRFFVRFFLHIPFKNKLFIFWTYYEMYSVFNFRKPFKTTSNILLLTTEERHTLYVHSLVSNMYIISHMWNLYYRKYYLCIIFNVKNKRKSNKRQGDFEITST